MPSHPPAATRGNPQRADVRQIFDTLSGSTLLTLDEAASVLGVSPHTIKANRRDGKGPEAVKLGRSVRYTVDGLRKLIAAGRKAS